MISQDPFNNDVQFSGECDLHLGLGLQMSFWNIDFLMMNK